MTEIVRLRQVAEINPPLPEFDDIDDLDEVTFIPLEAVWPASDLDVTRTRAKGEVTSGYTRFREGDILVPKITPTFEANRTAIARGLRGGIGCGTTELHVVRPGSTLDTRYALYVLSSAEFLAGGEACMTGVAGQQRVPDLYLRNLSLPLPILEEQRAIASFLDAETARIDQVIQKRSAMVDLLVEFEAALIDRIVWAVSGVLTPLMHLTGTSRPIMYGIVLPGPDVAEGVLLVKGGDIEAGRLSAGVLARTAHEIEAPFARARLFGNDIVFAIRGSVGAAAMVPPQLAGANITQDVARISPATGLNPRWLLYALKSLRLQGQVRSRITGATIRGINIWDLKRCSVPVPSPGVRDDVADELDRRVGEVSRLRNGIEAQVRRLQERRAAVITAAVTRRIAVPA